MIMTQAPKQGCLHCCNLTPLTHEQLNKWREEFFSTPKNILAQNICLRNNLHDLCISRKALEDTNHIFTHKVDPEGRPVTYQGGSGTCWIFAAMNFMRLPFMKKHEISSFEFSQSYLFYWDKIERCNYFLNSICQLFERGEDDEGRLIKFLLKEPVNDGGQWDMLVNLVNKYGVMPKDCFLSSYSAERSSGMNSFLTSKLREYAKVLRELKARGDSLVQMRDKITEQMAEVYKIVGICLGIPPTDFTWEYYGKDNTYKSIGPITPMKFYKKYVKPHIEIEDKVCLVSDPRVHNTYDQTYTIECLGNIIGGRPIIYNNQPIELLMAMVTDSIKKGEVVWFGCDISKRHGGRGIGHLDIRDYKLLFDTDIQINLSKADRLLYEESAMTHAMVFTGVSIGNDGQPSKFRIENSWGVTSGEKGYIVISKDWFTEFVFEIVVDKNLVPDSIMEVFAKKPRVLPAWDPMGSLARN